MPDLDVADLARTLEKTAAGLERHIATEAQKRAAKLAKEYAKAADERIRDNAVDMQRLQDLVVELRRQMKPLIRDGARYSRIVAAVRSAKWAGGETIRLDDLLDIINAPVNTSTPKEPPS